MANSKKRAPSRFQTQYDAGIVTFCRLFTHWMDTNRWTHPIFIDLVTCCLDGSTWFHSSQISSLRQSKLRNPGPRGFMAIAELNKAIHRYKTTKALIPNTKSDSTYLQSYAITEDGEAPDVGWWFEVFCGYRVPKDIDLDTVFRTEADASEFSRNYAKLLRQLITDHGFNLIDHLDQVLRTYYPAGDRDRVAKLGDILLNRSVWTIEEANVELPALLAMTSELGGPTTQEELMAAIR